MIKFIPASDTLAIRSEVLKAGKLPPEKCSFPADEDEGSFHLGFFVADRLVSVVSFHHRRNADREGDGYRLDGMATLAEFRGRGYGNKLINFASVYLRRRKANYIWCKALKAACNFYERVGFAFISEEYDIPEIGPHRDMFFRIQ